MARKNGSPSGGELWRPNKKKEAGIHRRGFLKGIIGGAVESIQTSKTLGIAGEVMNAPVAATIVGGAAFLYEKLKTPPSFITRLRESPSANQRIDELLLYYPTIDETYPGRKPVIGSPFQSRIQYVEAELMRHVPNEDLTKYEEGIHALSEVLPYLWIGVPRVESEYENDAVSLDRHGDPLAQHLGQITNDTWEDYIRSTGHQVSIEQRKYLSNQIRVMGWKIGRVLRTLQQQVPEELSFIRSEYFGGDHYRFTTEFLVFALISGYQSGERNIANVIRGFRKEGRITGIERFDVMNEMFSRARTGVYDTDFKTDSSEYPLRVLAAALSLHASTTSVVR